ncbi:MAG: hypothetical protein M1825_001172 [Sarcosagium campestre]|nr:MAG: hypothetical protein M1825_001172 [Sarcosagium campestre]
MTGKKVAIVGSGCSGIGALWALKSTDHDVHLFEADGRLGGHTNTVPFVHGDEKIMVDTGFIVMNSATYPNFISFLKQINVPTAATEMTFGVSRDEGAFEWSGASLSTIFAQKRNLLRPSMWRMIFDIVRFNQFALDLLADEDHSDLYKGESVQNPKLLRNEESIGEYLEREHYSESFKNNYLIPMTASVWSTSPDKCFLQFPAMTLVRFLWNHHLLNTISARPEWRTIPGGSAAYIRAALTRFPRDRVHLNTPIVSVTNAPDGRVVLKTASGDSETFDHVILATHGDQAFRLIQETATDDETRILSSFETSKNTAVLHSDLSHMPIRTQTWSSWNYMTRSSPSTASRSTSSNSTTTRASSTHDIDQVSLTYSMNILQHIPSARFGPVLVTLNPLQPPSPALTQGEWTYAHPLYNARAIAAQRQLHRVQNTRGISYCGAWTKYGFHEDGFTSGLTVAVNHLGASLPFDLVDSTFARGARPAVLGWRDRLVRLVISLVHLWIVLLATALDLLLAPGLAILERRGRRHGHLKLQ